MADKTYSPISDLLERFDTILLDAYGVLVDSAGPLAYAVEFISQLNALRKSYYVVTNDSSKLPTTALERYRSFGIPLHADSVISSGSLLHGYFIRHELVGTSCVVLGPPDSHEYVRQAGGVIVEPSDPFDVVVIGDEGGFDFLPTMDMVLSRTCKLLSQGKKVRLILPNPDLVFPKPQGELGFASGTLALMLEAALALRFPGRTDLKFERLGKPYRPIFEEAHRRSGTMNMVMIGDQLETDIRGANSFGIASALIATGVISPEGQSFNNDVRPVYLLKSLAL